MSEETALDPARREELAEAVRRWDMELAEPFNRLERLIARWLADARAEGAAEVRARVEALLDDDVLCGRDPARPNLPELALAAKIRDSLIEHRRTGSLIPPEESYID